MPVADRPLVLVHGYSDSAEGFERWRKILNAWGRPTESVHIGQYVSLNNEVSLKDVAEGFDRALRDRVGLGTHEEFDAIVHSTGMLVVRAWLNSYAAGTKRRKRLKRLIALAPATNGSPLAHKGRSWMGSIFKGNKERGPDFMEAGDEILYNLELASRFTWDLAHDDLIRSGARFRQGPETPFVFTFCGNRNYGFWKNLVTDEEGSDGTVRWAGAPLNSRKITIDLRVPPGSRRKPKFDFSDWANQDHPLVLMDGLDHGTIMSKPSKLLQELVRDALAVETARDFSAWNRQALEKTEPARKKVDAWQQFVIRVVDERGDPVTDWNAQLFQAGDDGRVQEFSVRVHPYKRDESLRCFHVNLADLKPKQLKTLKLRIIATSGTQLVAYHGHGSERITPDGKAMNPEGVWDAIVDMTAALKGEKFKLFHPFTTTFVEICLNREPMPMVGENRVFWFPKES